MKNHRTIIKSISFSLLCVLLTNPIDDLGVLANSVTVEESQQNTIETPENSTDKKKLSTEDVLNSTQKIQTPTSPEHHATDDTDNLKNNTLKSRKGQPQIATVNGTITYLDESGNTLLPSKAVPSQIGGTFNFSVAEPINGYQLDLTKSKVLTTINGSLQTVTIKEAMGASHVETLDAFIAHINQQAITAGVQDVELQYVYNNITVNGTITYLDESGNTLLPSKAVPSQIGGTFNFSVAEPINGYQLDLTKSKVLTTINGSLQSITIKEAMAASHIETLDAFIAHINQQAIAVGVQNVELQYVYTKDAVSGGDITVSYEDESGHKLAEDMIQSGNVG
ncbi:MAG TPA: hypothetical protein DIS86_05015, partial [Lactococcus sp.]|nr:hypothetical protein [Lactococcus sp.]